MTTMPAAIDAAYARAAHMRSKPTPRHRAASDATALPRTFRIGVIEVTAASTIPGVLEEYTEMYAPWQRDRRATAVTVSATRGRSRYRVGRRFLITGGGERLFSVKRIEEVLPHLEWAVNWEVVRRVDRYVQIHAAVLETRQRGLILAGQPGSGKTTLSAGLMTRGWKFLSDEFALIDPADGLLQPYPKALCVKEGAFNVVRDLGLPLTTGRRYRKGQKGRVAYVSPALMDNDVVGRPSRPAVVVFPTFVQGAATTLTPITRGEAAFLLNRFSFNARRFGPSGIDVIARVTRKTHCYKLTGGSLDESCNALQRLIEDDAA